MRNLLIIGETHHALKKELEKLMYTIIPYQDKLVRETDGILIDLENTSTLTSDQKNTIEENNKPLIIINREASNKLMCNLIGVGFETKYSIVNLHSQNTFITPIAEKSELVTSPMETEHTRVEVHEEGAKKYTTIESLNEAPSDHERSTEPEILEEELNLEEVAFLIESEIQEESRLFHSKYIPQSSTIPVDLLENQYRVYYVSLNKIISFYSSNKGGRVIQKSENELLVEIILAASSTPKAKFVQINTYGAGFNPTSGGKIYNNSYYNRGYFQNRIDIHLEPLRNNRVQTFETSPKNINGEHTYTASTSFTMGVNISKNPGLEPSYTSTSSKTTSIKDFLIINKSSGAKANWTFHLSMTKDDIGNIFHYPFMQKPWVEYLPTLATDNLQPCCSAVWLVDEASKPFNDRVTYLMKWEVEYYQCRVTDEFLHYSTRTTQSLQKHFRNYVIDYSQVQA